MRIIVFSDSHGNTKALEAIYHKHPAADRYIHLGDGMHDVRALREKYPGMNLLAVKGNTDFTSADAETAFLETDGKKIIYTHGHIFSVKQGLSRLEEYGEKKGAHIVLFGHTHEPYYNYRNGIHYLNPGKAEMYGACRFGIVDITENGIACVAATLDPAGLR
jgi:phosphoesterase, MJ0936 family